MTHLFTTKTTREAISLTVAILACIPPATLASSNQNRPRAQKNILRTTAQIESCACRRTKQASELGANLVVERKVKVLRGVRVSVTSIRFDPNDRRLTLRILHGNNGMTGLHRLNQLCEANSTIVAVNGGYFNANNFLPLGALRDQGKWLSGPILNRGAAGWESGEFPEFGRLSLKEAVSDTSGRNWQLTSLNSGYINHGISRYTSEWGKEYKAITTAEAGTVLNRGIIVRQYNTLKKGDRIPLGSEDNLLISRKETKPHWKLGEKLTLHSEASHSLGLHSNVIGGGPLLLINGKVVLNGRIEGFSELFLSQSAPRTILATDNKWAWLITLHGIDNPGPTLEESALLLKQLGFLNALNLDGGTSTDIELHHVTPKNSRYISRLVHNAIGLSVASHKEVLQQ